MNRYLKAFIVTTIIYIMIIGSFIYAIEDTKQNQSAKKSLQRVNITILTPKPPQKKIEPKKVAKPKPKPKPKPKMKPKKIEPKKIVKKQKPKPKAKPKKVVKKITPKKIIKKIKPKKIEPKKVSKPKPKVKPKKIEPKKIVKKQKLKPKKEQKFIPKKQIKQTVSKSKQGVNKQNDKLVDIKKQKYYEMVKTTITNNKKYPKRAVRRGIEGSVELKFIVTKDGVLKEIKIIDGKSIFYKSAKKAIKNSFPLSPPKGIFQKDIELEIKIVYRLY